MRAGPADPYPKRGRRIRSDAEFIARQPRPRIYAAVTAVVTREYSARRSAGMLQVLIFLTLQAIYSPSGVMLGHGELAERFGVSRRTLVDRLGEWRNVHRMIDRKKRGRKGSDVTWWAASNDLIREVATELRARGARHSRVKVKRGNTSQTQRANFPHVAAPSGRPERAAPKDDHQTATYKPWKERVADFLTLDRPG